VTLLLLRSVDFGLSFSLIPLQAGSYYFRDFLWLNNTTVLGLAKSASGFYKVFKSLDSGANVEYRIYRFCFLNRSLRLLFLMSIFIN